MCLCVSSSHALPPLLYDSSVCVRAFSEEGTESFYMEKEKRRERKKEKKGRWALSDMSSGSGEEEKGRAVQSSRPVAFHTTTIRLASQ